jgi:hypothetical protein
VVEVDGGFECGAVEAVSVEEPDGAGGDVTVRFAAPLAGSPAGMWFCFRVRHVRGRRLRLTQTNVRQMLGGRDYAAVVPVARDGPDGPWRRLPRGDVAWDEEAGTLAFAAVAGADDWYCALAHPYGLADLERLLRDLAGSPDVRRESAGRTQRGRDLPCILVGPARGARHLVVCTGRHHSGEAPGSHVLEGVLRAAAQDDAPAAAWLRRHVLLAVFPMVDLDGVVEGRYGKDRPPVDPNRDWAYDPVRPEVRAVTAAIERLAATAPPAFFCDFHAPAPRDPTFFVPGHPALADRSRWAQMVAFARALERHAPPGAACRLADAGYGYLDWAHAHYEVISAYSMQLRYGVPVGTLEATYHRDAGGGYVEPAGLRALGRAWVRSLVELLRDGPTAADAADAAEPPLAAPAGAGAAPLPAGVTRALQERQTLAELPAIGWGAAWRLVNRLVGLRAAWDGGALRVEPEAGAGAATRLRACAAEAFPLRARAGAPPSLRLPVALEAPGGATLEVACSYLRERRRYTALDVRYLRVAPGGQQLSVDLRPPAGADAVRLAVAASGLPGALTLGTPVVGP